ncbi:acyltransferase [Serratia liquefaciens]
MKGTNIASGCVVAANSVVSGDFLESNCLIAGSPARVVKRNISWKL